jgi:hypothetical protein
MCYCTNSYYNCHNYRITVYQCCRVSKITNTGNYQYSEYTGQPYLHLFQRRNTRKYLRPVIYEYYQVHPFNQSIRHRLIHWWTKRCCQYLFFLLCSFACLLILDSGWTEELIGFTMIVLCVRACVWFFVFIVSIFVIKKFQFLYLMIENRVQRFP